MKIDIALSLRLNVENPISKLENHPLSRAWDPRLIILMLIILDHLVTILKQR